MSTHVLTRWLLLAAALPAAAQTLPTASCQRNSPAHTVALVELYTSEGCSSCPPADQWLSTLAARYGPQQVVPLSLHVDYWDYIGWRDPFAQAHFSERQRLLGLLAGTSTIYTPEVFVGMRELRGWRDLGTFERRLQEIQRQPARAQVTLAMTAGSARRIEATAAFTLLAPVAARGDLQGVLVVYENGLTSPVHRGENRGATLRHDHVVRFWSTPLPLRGDGARHVLRETVNLAPDWNVGKLGIAAFVQDTRSGEVLQALALPACLPATS